MILLGILLLLALALASGAAGWRAHAVVEDRRMRRLLARIHADLAGHH